MSFNNLIGFMEYFKDDQACMDFIHNLRFKDGVFCPHCNSSKVYSCNQVINHKQIYKCPSCNKKFHCLINTFFENTKLSMKKWFICVYLVSTSSKGISSVQLSKQAEITQKTAWTVLQRYVTHLEDDDDFFGGKIEVDETYIGGKEKNKHQNRKTPNTQGRSTKTKTPVLGMIDRSGDKRVKAFHVQNVTSNTINSYVAKHIEPYSTVYTDEFRNYNRLSPQYKR